MFIYAWANQAKGITTAKTVGDSPIVPPKFMKFPFQRPRNWDVPFVGLRNDLMKNLIIGVSITEFCKVVV